MGDNADLRAHVLFLGVAFAAAWVSGCASVVPGGSNGGSTGHIACADDSSRCLDARRVALKGIMADKSRSWIQRAPTANSYASGVRLFAYMKLKRSLTCKELATGVHEGAGARRTLRAAAGQLTPAQISRGALLGDEVAKHLRREMRRRGCREKA